MSQTSVDLFSALFWLTVVVALALLTPLVRARDRRIAFAAVNLGFLTFLLRYRIAGAVGGVAILYVLLRSSARLGRGGPAFAAVLAASMGAFVLHKSPHWWPAPSLKEALEPFLIGIGFSYTFLRTLDVARAVHSGRHLPPDILSLFNYLVPFHMLAAGPIQAYDDFAARVADVPVRLDAVAALRGAERVVLGLFKKYVIAYSIERLFLTEFMADGWYFVLEMHLYALWFYIDFSAYSDVAVGLGKLMGIHTPENFNRPYRARNMIDFWERWHITLGDWIRRNLFITTQLELVRRTRGRHQLLLSLMTVGVAFTLCGLWHGLSLPFLIWGAMHGAGVIVANLYRHVLGQRLGKKRLKMYLQNRWIRRVATFITLEWVVASLVVVGWHWEFNR